MHGFVNILDESRKGEMQLMAASLKLEKVGLTCITAGERSRVVGNYKLKGAKNVVVLSTQNKVVENLENVDAAEFAKVDSAAKALAK